MNMFRIPLKAEQVFSGHSIAYCCLGTTRAQAGSAEEFVRIDKDIPLQAARLFHKGETQTTQSDKNLQHFVLLSSTGSNASSWFLYPKTKGELEQQIIGMGFNRVSIVRPGLLDYRPDQRPTRRIMEEWMMPILDVVAPRSAILGVTQLGKAMCKMGEQWLDEFSKNNDTLSKVQVYENNDILNLAEQE
ncbi:hypothetical protein QVD99_007877 [Batrachochytrium dendrobatidis]|nr:hypothetical protein QVD99_007877 [Batrachochytrium dendrobatidis]